MDLEMPATDRQVMVSPSGEVILNYRTLVHAADALACGLGRSIGPGDVVCAVLPNGPRFAAALLATWRLGACFAALDPRLTGAELRTVLGLLQPRALVVREPPASVPDTVRAIAAGDAPVETRAAPARPSWSDGPGPSDADRLILFTSGSTGTPKGVLLTDANVRAGIAAVSGAYRLDANDVTAALLPWTHGHGLFGLLLGTLRAGGTILLPGALPAVRALGGPAGSRLTWLSVVPPMLSMLCDAGCRLPGLRFVRTASAALPPPLAAAAESRFGCPVSQAYGMTETAHQTAANPITLADRRPGTVGLPTGVELRLTGDEMGGGRLLEVRGASVFRGYLGSAAATSAALTGDGWYRTRDIAAIDGDGFLRLLGRSGDLINSGGFKVAPPEVENALCEHPDVRAALVAALPHTVLGEEVAAVVVPRPGAELTEGELHRHCAERLVEYKRPARYRFVPALPCLPNGKPSRAAVPALFR
jgi:oxalate---CoA ligase